MAELDVTVQEVQLAVVWLVLPLLDGPWPLVVVFCFGVLDPPDKPDCPGAERDPDVVQAEGEDKLERTIQYFGWSVVNVSMIFVGACVALFLNSAGEPSVGQALLVPLLCPLRTALDYAWSWHFYLPVETSDERG